MYKMKFNIWGEVDICEAHHCSIIALMVNGKDFDMSKKEEMLNYYACLVRVTLMPYENEYRVYVAGSHIAIDRKDDHPVKSLAGKRLGVIGLEDVPEDTSLRDLENKVEEMRSYVRDVQMLTYKKDIGESDGHEQRRQGSYRTADNMMDKMDELFPKLM